MSIHKCRPGWLTAIIVCATALPVAADWNPAAGQWGKSDPDDVRVMTFNILDGICSGASKAEGSTSWCALARIVAAMQPDVLIIQEAGDNQGDHGSGGVDSVANLQTTLELFIHGGTDPFLGGTVGAYVQKYAPAFDLPYVWASSTSDGYNRNVILSRFPYADLNGDGISQRSDIPYVLLDPAVGYVEAAGAGGIRGVMVGELDLPDNVYAGDLLIENAHLKAGSAAEDHTDRILAAQRMAYHNDYLLNGAGTGIPDPNGKIIDAPAVTSILPADTPVIFGGDWNEDEQTNGTKGPAEWIASAATLGGTDGTDRDRTDATYDDARNPYNNQRYTTGSSKKYDYLCWQDSIASIRRAIIFNSIGLPTGWYPPEIVGYPTPASISTTASDHRPVFVDFILPLVPSPDVTPPSPDPMTFATPPYATSASAIAMTATTATDVESPPVEYYFNFVSGGTGGNDSGWQSSASFADSGLAPNTLYTYRVKARDSASTPNETAYSGALSATTLANVPAAPTLGNPTAATLDIDVNPNGNPASTEFALLCSATSDANWVGKYVDAAGNPAAAAVWQTDAQWSTLTIRGLLAATEYCFEAQARNSDAVETAFSTPSCAETTAVITPGDLNCDGSVNFQDINPFVLALSNPSAYDTTYPDCDILSGDISGDGTTDFRDINPFVSLLSSPP